jgi:hypothetical protein
MKKSILYTVLGFLAIASVIATSCKKQVNCATLVTSLANATQNYTNDQSIANCTAYKAALQAMVDNASDCSLDATAVSTYQSVINSLTCQ